jgi:hypothetical protein
MGTMTTGSIFADVEARRRRGGPETTETTETTEITAMAEMSLLFCANFVSWS